MVLIAVVAGAGLGLAVGRRPPALAGHRAPWVALALAAAGAACLVAGSTRLPVALSGYVMLLGAAVLEWKRAGMVLVAAGLLANLVVIAVNRGMPVKGLPPGAAAGRLHHGLAASDRLVGLSDVIRLPLLSVTASPGDLVLALGVAVVMFGWLQPRRPAIAR